MYSPATSFSAINPHPGITKCSTSRHLVIDRWLPFFTNIKCRIELQAHPADTSSVASPQVVEDQRYTAESSDSQAKDAFVGTLEDAVLHNTNQFHKWHSELEAACALETEEKYKRYADLLNSHLRSTETILSKVCCYVSGWVGG